MACETDGLSPLRRVTFNIFFMLDDDTHCTQDPKALHSRCPVLNTLPAWLHRSYADRYSSPLPQSSIIETKTSTTRHNPNPPLGNLLHSAVVRRSPIIIVDAVCFRDVRNFQSSRALRSDFIENEAASSLLRSLISGEARKIRTATQHFGELSPCEYAVALAGIRESSGTTVHCQSRQFSEISETHSSSILVGTTRVPAASERRKNGSRPPRPRLLRRKRLEVRNMQHLTSDEPSDTNMESFSEPRASSLPIKGVHVSSRSLTGVEIGGKGRRQPRDTLSRRVRVNIPNNYPRKSG